MIEVGSLRLHLLSKRLGGLSGKLTDCVHSADVSIAVIFELVEQYLIPFDMFFADVVL